MMVWLVGHSFVKWAERHASRKKYGSDLGMGNSGVKIRWQGKGGMLWRELRVALNRMLKGNMCPDMLVLHLGENEKEIKAKWSGTFVMWSEWIAHRVWRGQ